MLSGGTLSACAMAGTAVFRIVVSNDSMKKPTATSHGRRRLAVWLKVTVSRACKAIERSASVACERRVHDVLRLGDQPVQMPGAMKALGVDLVNIFGSRPARAVISADSSAGTRPSLSVVQTLPSSRLNEAPALSSPPKPRLPSMSPLTNHLKPTGTSYKVRPSLKATRSIMALLTAVLPTAASARQRGRWRNK